jgi:hypothetical protein
VVFDSCWSSSSPLLRTTVEIERADGTGGRCRDDGDWSTDRPKRAVDRCHASAFRHRAFDRCGSDAQSETVLLFCCHLIFVCGISVRGVVARWKTTRE